jgi:hypothetical protein
VRPDPDPEDAVLDVHAERPVMQTDANRPIAADTLQAERWMTGSALSNSKLLSASARTVSGSAS